MYQVYLEKRKTSQGWLCRLMRCGHEDIYKCNKRYKAQAEGIFTGA
jgi:hypothetical protein